jgi:hypothetical protein
MEIFDVTAKPIIDSVMEGYNGTIFAYGQVCNIHSGMGRFASNSGISGLHTFGLASADGYRQEPHNGGQG